MLAAGDMGAAIVRRDWAATGLGPIAIWPAELIALIETMLLSPLATLLALGAARLFLCNDAAAAWFGPDCVERVGEPAATWFERVWPAGASALKHASAGEALLLHGGVAGWALGNGAPPTHVQLAPWRVGEEAAGCVQIVFFGSPAPAALAERERENFAEFRRRMRNMLGVLRSVARRTAENSATVEDFAMHFEGRLDALARVEAIAAGAPQDGIDLQTLIAEELLVFGSREPWPVAISGPALRLNHDAAETLGLALHELAANAVKYGALSPRGGRLDVSWSLPPKPDDALLLTWKETSRATVQRQRRGFGSDLLERGLSYRLKARTKLTFAPQGLVCELRIPLAGVVA